MAEIRYRTVQKTYPDGTRAVRGLDLEIGDGELMVLVGPSGCGKSTALRMLAGLEEISDGEIEIGGRVVNDLTPQERNVAMVFQSYALYPHMTVRENLAFPLRMNKTPREEADRRIAEAARMLSIDGLLEKKPRQLSGGQRQRVAMGRALVREPEAFLMDEPLSNLDAKLRVQMRSEIASLQRRLGTTTLYVTHDQVEALTLADRMAVLSAGELQQVGTPEEIYEHPANVFVASFIGSPSIYLFESRLAGEDGPAIAFGEVMLPLPPETAGRLGGRQRQVIAGLRPEAFAPGADGPPELRFRTEVAAVEALGHELVVYVEPPAPPTAGTGPHLAARLPGTFHAEPGDEIELSVDPGQVYLFDREGRAL